MQGKKYGSHSDTHPHVNNLSYEKNIEEIEKSNDKIEKVKLTKIIEKYINENGAFDISKCGLIAYANGGYFYLDKKIGKFGYSVQKYLK